MIGDRIKDLRIKKGITQDTLAKQLHISPQAVSKWEQNVSVPDITLLLPIADYFEVTVDYLLREPEQDAISKISSMIESRICRYKKSAIFKGTIKNCSAYSFAFLELKVRFLDDTGAVIDYREIEVQNFDPQDTKHITVMTQVADNVAYTETIIQTYELALA